MNIDFPFHFDQKGRTAGTSDEDHIRDMIEQFLFTQPGERVNRPDFGSGIMQLVFAPNSPELAATLQFTMNAGLMECLGDLIDIQSLEVTAEDSILRVSLTYMIRRTKDTRTDEFERRVA